MKYGTVTQHQCSGCSQVQVGPYFRGLPAVPPTPWPNSYGLTPYLVIWHGAHTGFRSNGLTCWVRGLVYVPFLWLASLIWGGSMQPDCSATLPLPRQAQQGTWRQSFSFSPRAAARSPLQGQG
ncbi:hypothetical protein mRhiFer1_007839 [Rhinolophus ferrumequinum]|uniref:Uncharacterized protein n=1 Tax=Rhinolophus ferrumequinum TaxID=59479 RepID=A0A7J8AV28_RHIFE|nr:hypothetical protein mRhiFer1_007839 [Rhinolophus ferrumequinum]